MHILEEKIIKAKKAGRVALIPFVSAGFPTPDRFCDLIRELDTNGADIIEIGIPFSDPVADGPVVEEASRRALAAGVSLTSILKDLQSLSDIRAGLVLMGYINPIIQYGYEKFAADAASAGVSGCIIPDLPLEESLELRKLLSAKRIALITLVGQNTAKKRMEEYAAVSEGFIYVVSVLGTTGVRHTLPKEVLETLRLAREVFSLPLALGFGMASREHIEAIPEDLRPDAAVFGSALIEHINEKKPVKDFFAAWK